MKDRVRCLSAPGPLHCGLFPSEDRANRTRSRLGENVFARVCVCVCSRATDGGKKRAGHGGREEEAGIRASPGRRGDEGTRSRRTPRWSMNRGHTRRSRERNTAYAPCTRVLRLYPVSLLRTIRPTDGSIESIRGRNKAATRAAHLHLHLLLLPLLLLRHFPCLACFFPPRMDA